jgi:hypothetical protein
MAEDKILTGPLTTIPVRKFREVPKGSLNPMIKIIAEKASHCLTSWAERNSVSPENPNLVRVTSIVDNLKKVAEIKGE